jgi:predicted ATPase
MRFLSHRASPWGQGGPAQLEGLVRRRPVLALWEDVQWIDPTSLDLLDLLVERVRTLSVLVIITFRPEFRSPWTGQPHVTSLTLNRLSRKHGAAIVERLTGGKAVPAEVQKQIVAKTDGVPLFVEELTKAVLESGLLQEETTGTRSRGRCRRWRSRRRCTTP